MRQAGSGLAGFPETPFRRQPPPRAEPFDQNLAPFQNEWVEGKRKLIILVAEDDANDVLLLNRAFKKNGIDLPVYVCSDGEDAMCYLKGEGKYADREKHPFPRVLITDLKMPKFSGFDLLEWLYRHPECSLIPKIVFSSSSHPEDVKRAYQLGVNCYLQKPSTFDELVRIVGVVNNFWLEAILPELPLNC